jgi:imidazolonepropionase-like amidohydrolase
MIASTLLLGALSVLAADKQDKTVLPAVYALRVGRAETIANGTLEHAVLLVENGKLTVVGEDLPVERGIQTFDRPDWVVMPGLVGVRSRIGLTARGSNNSNPEVKASGELYPQPAYAELIKSGVTTLGLVPPGEGIPGQAVAVRTAGASAAEMILRDPAYLFMQVRADTKSKKMVIDGFAAADEHAEKVKKAKEKWDKEQEKSKKSSKPKEEEKKADDKKGEEKKGEEKGGDEKGKEEKPPEGKQEEGKEKAKKDEPVFTPPEPDPKVKPFLALRDGTLSAVVDISKAGEYLHVLDVLKDEKVSWSLMCVLHDDIDLYEITEAFGKTAGRIVLTPEVTLQPFTRRDRNLPAEFAAAGAKVALLPRSDSPAAYDSWLTDVGNVVRFGLPRDVALRAITLEPAEVLGVAERVGSLEAGKDANLILLDGDPLQPETRIQMVILEGKNAYEYEAPTTGGDPE